MTWLAKALASVGRWFRSRRQLSGPLCIQCAAYERQLRAALDDNLVIEDGLEKVGLLDSGTRRDFERQRQHLTVRKR